MDQLLQDYGTWLIGAGVAGVLLTLLGILWAGLRRRRSQAGAENDAGAGDKTPPPETDRDEKKEEVTQTLSDPQDDTPDGVDKPATPPSPPSPPAPMRLPEEPPADDLPASEPEDEISHRAGRGRPFDFPARKQDGKDIAIMEVYFGTDRAEITTEDPRDRFGSDRGAFTYGGCRVSIPATHRPGELEAPKWWRLEFSEDPTRHVVLREVLTTNKDDFFAALGNKIRQTGTRQAFLFVHGYNVSFADAARRTAQIAYDMNFDGAPIFYSWPSQGTVRAYTADEANVEWATPNLRGFIKDILDRAGPTQLHLIAHSMGSRALTQALAQLRAELDDNQRAALKEVILAAPDIDADVFLRDIVPAITSTGARLTLYAAADDKALEASQKVHKYPRAGDIRDLPTYPAEVDVIDATECDTGFLGHSPFSGRSMIADMFNLLTHGHGPEQRMLREIQDERGRYWRIEA